MYNVEFKPRADEDLSKMDNSLAQRFIKHSKRMAFNPSKKHLMHGKPYFIEKVTEQARMAFFIEFNTLYVIRCFKNHKEYEDWYKSLE